MELLGSNDSKGNDKKDSTAPFLVLTFDKDEDGREAKRRRTDVCL